MALLLAVVVGVGVTDLVFPMMVVFIGFPAALAFCVEALFSGSGRLGFVPVWCARVWSDGSNPVLVRWMRPLWLGSLVVFACQSPAGGCSEFSIGRGAVSSSCWIAAAAVEDREAGV
ncbi:hypothetical protein RHMOL_Rhmol05G0175500 [Rhododendron molle]|uniref:Uncharacterized protein n=1 Tax=Rhododendron molle TaxID=49168 RepID=A0ACC0NQF7_RHOML|nr:hypothetical protein RHMOL_Rhmol05G0175500 [Rhododendron molle]